MFSYYNSMRGVAAFGACLVKGQYFIHWMNAQLQSRMWFSLLVDGGRGSVQCSKNCFQRKGRGVRRRKRVSAKMAVQSAGYHEIEHTADWELHVWAPDLSALFEQAARGMYALSGTRLQNEPRQMKYLELSAADIESLLVIFLEELLFLGEQDHLGFDAYDDVRLDENRIELRLEGAPILSQSKEIKAVTYHNLEIRESKRGYEVNIVFDV